MTTPQEEARALQKMAQAIAISRRNTIDETRGAPAGVRATVGSAQTPDDRLATIQKYYPDAVAVDDGNFVFTDPKTKRPTLYNPKGIDAGDIASIAPEIAEMGGGAAAAAVASPAAIAAAPATGGASLLGIPAAYGLGASGGRELQNIIATNLGETVDTRGLGQRAVDAGATAAGNVLGYRAGEAISTGVQRATAPIVNAARNAIAPQGRGNAVALANAGVEPRAGTITQSPSVQMVEQGLASTPGGAGPITEKARSEVADIAREADEVSRLFGPRGSAEDVGNAIKEGAKNAASRFRARKETLYSGAYDLVGKGTAIDTGSIAPLKAYADELEAVITKSPNEMGGALGRTLERVKGILADAENGVLDFETLRKIRTNIGNDLSDPVLAGMSTTQRQGLNPVYGAISDVLNGIASRTPEGAKKLAIADRYTRFNMQTNMDTLQKIADLDYGEKVYKFALSGVKDGGSQLLKIRKNLKPEEWDMVAGTVLGKLGTPTAGRTGATEIGEETAEFSVSSFLTNWNRLSPEARNALFSGTRYADLTPRLNNLVKVVGLSKDADKLANTSGTARVLMTTLGLTGMFGGGGAYAAGLDAGDIAATGAGAFAGAVVAPRVAAKLITSPAFVTWLSNMVQAGPRSANNMKSALARLVTVGKVNPEIRNEIYQYYSAIRPEPVPEDTR